MTEHLVTEDRGIWVEDDNWLVYDLSTPITTGIICCDCSLVHHVHLQLSGKKLKVQYRRSDRLTEWARRHIKRFLTSKMFQKALVKDGERE